MSKKIYKFDVPVSGRETFSVIASSYEEALEKINKEDYETSPQVEDIDWDFGLGRDSSEFLPQCFTLSDIQEPTHD